MGEYTLSDLEVWDEKICEIAGGSHSKKVETSSWYFCRSMLRVFEEWRKIASGWQTWPGEDALAYQTIPCRFKLGEAKQDANTGLPKIPIGKINRRIPQMSRGKI